MHLLLHIAPQNPTTLCKNRWDRWEIWRKLTILFTLTLSRPIPPSPPFQCWVLDVTCIVTKLFCTYKYVSTLFTGGGGARPIIKRFWKVSHLFRTGLSHFLILSGSLSILKNMLKSMSRYKIWMVLSQLKLVLPKNIFF